MDFFYVSRLARRVRGIVSEVAFASSVTPAPNAADVLQIGALTGPITIENPSGTPTDGQKFSLRITQDTPGGRVITWGSAYAFGTDITSAGLPTTAAAKYEVDFRYHAGTSKWRAVGQARGF